MGKKANDSLAGKCGAVAGGSAKAGSTVTVTLKLSPARVVLLSQDVTGYKSLEKDTGGGEGGGGGGEVLS